MTEEPVAIPSETSVAELLGRWPQVIPLFLSRRMGCVGCSMAAFDTILDAANNYQIPVDKFMLELRGAIDPHT